jgi:hypothetical protein
LANHCQANHKRPKIIRVEALVIAEPREEAH